MAQSERQCQSLTYQGTIWSYWNDFWHCVEKYSQRQQDCHSFGISENYQKRILSNLICQCEMISTFNLQTNDKGRADINKE